MSHSFFQGTALAAIVLAANCNAGTPVDPAFAETVFVNSPALSPASSMAWAPDGSQRLFVTLVTGQVIVVKDGALLAAPFVTISPIAFGVAGGGGLLGMCFDPNFTSNHFVYFFVTVSGTEQQIIRYEASGDIGINKTVIVASLPVGQHCGGGIEVGPDGRIYFGVGDLGTHAGAGGDLISMASKIGRAHLDGSAPADNPFFDGAGPNNDYVWMRGVRQPFTLTFQPGPGKLWVNDVGSDPQHAGYEQVFVAKRGAHAGWDDYENTQPSGFLQPRIAYPTNGTAVRDLVSAARVGGRATFTTLTPHSFHRGEKVTVSGTSAASFAGSVFVTEVLAGDRFAAEQAGPDESATSGTVASQPLGGSVTGGCFYSGTAFPGPYRGNFFFGDYMSGDIMRVTLDAANEVTGVDFFVHGIAQCVDVTTGPDGALYYLGVDATHSIYRLAPTTPEPGLIVSSTALNLAEGGSAVFEVRLATPPAASITVEIARVAGDPSVSIVSGAALVFTPANFAVPQLVWLAAEEDADAVNDSATFSVSAPGLASCEVRVNTIDDDDAPPVCEILAPTAGAVVSGTAVAWSGRALDDRGTTRAQFFIDGILSSTDTNGTGTYNRGGAPGMWDTTGLTNGAHTLKITVFDTLGQTASEERTVFVGNGIGAWKAQHFPGVADPLIVGDAADPDGDGLRNLLEYAIDSPPDHAPGGATIATIQSLTGGEFLTLRYVRVRWAQDVIYRVGISGDLVSWTSLDPEDAALQVSLLPDTPRPGLDTITIRDPQPVSAPARRFMRLEVTMP